MIQADISLLAAYPFACLRLFRSVRAVCYWKKFWKVTKYPCLKEGYVVGNVCYWKKFWKVIKYPCPKEGYVAGTVCHMCYGGKS